MAALATVVAIVSTKAMHEGGLFAGHIDIRTCPTRCSHEHAAMRTHSFASSFAAALLGVLVQRPACSSVPPPPALGHPHVTVTATATAGAHSLPASTHSNIAGAQHRVRELRAAGVAGEIVLVIGAGVHPPFSVEASDSGLHSDARTVYRGTGPRTLISGGTEVPPSLFKPNPSASSPARLTADITSLGLDPAAFGSIVAAECVHTCSTTRAMLSFGGAEMTLARWPNYDRARGTQNSLFPLASLRFVLHPSRTPSCCVRNASRIQNETVQLPFYS